MHTLIQNQQKEIKNKEARQRGTVLSKSTSQSIQTGLPYGLQSKFEDKYGISFEDVRIHYNSEEPAKLNALAYTQGTDVYIAPHQEKHLNHELGHVVQQKCRRIPWTKTVNGHSVNDDLGLERQADQIGSFCSDIYSGAPTAADGEVAQLTQTSVEYVVIDASGKATENPTVIDGESVFVGQGIPGQTHSEQSAWNNAGNSVLRKIAQVCKDHKVKILFKVDNVVCDSCRKWFETTVYDALKGAASNDESKFIFIIQVTPTGQPTFEVTLKGNLTLWPVGSTDQPPLDRFSQQMISLGVPQSLVDDFSLGQPVNTVYEAILAENERRLREKYPRALLTELEQLFDSTMARVRNTGHFDQELDKIKLCDVLSAIENSYVREDFIEQLAYYWQATWKKTIGDIFYDAISFIAQL